MSDLFTWALLTATIRMTAPLLFAAMGGLISERSGIMNIALEGFMLIGAFTAVVGTYYTENAWFGLLCGVLAGGAGAAIHAFWTVTLKADQIVTGTALVLLGAGIPAFLIKRLFDQTGGTPSVERLPSLGGHMNILAPVAFLLIPLMHYFLFMTKPGLRLMSGGESPKAAESVGIPVTLYRYCAVIVSGMLAGMGGAYLSIGDLSQFTVGMTQGRGYIALAAVIFGNWTPFGAAAAALLFGFAQAFNLQAQAQGLFSKDLLSALPYLVTLIALTGLVRNLRGPAGLGKHATD
jgi:simple sugar transport system permease protein